MNKHNATAMIGSHVETGILTTEHAASSYGLPVFVAASDGKVFGSADCDAVSFGLDLDQFGADLSDFEARVVKAGYTIRA